MAKSSKFSIRIIGVIIWIVLTLALAGWWFIFALRLVTHSPEFQQAGSEQLIRQHRMLVTEGGFLFFMLLSGGLALLYYISRENRRAQQVQMFFTSFTHDLKTSLASLRLQAEALEEDFKDAEQSKLLRRLIKDTVRLQLQLENSLYVANPGSAALYIENLNLNKFFSSLSLQWPDLKLEVVTSSSVKADQRALESIFKNLIQNSVVHGQATEVKISERKQGEKIFLRVEDNGRGFNGSSEFVAKPFFQHSGSSGSGVGLYLVKMLARKMNGDAKFEFEPKFAAEVELPKAGS